MDIVLERILSLIPKGPDGKYVHGAKTKFAKKIGYNDGAIVAMWENGSSISYNKKLYQIAEEYNVSVEWLRGETDDPGIKKAPATEGEGYTDLQKAAIQFVLSLPPEKLERFIKMGRAAFEEDQ
jgi:transcriptional regulator with XRE-family HTH domain